jgi:hypothetical protein
MSGNLEVVALRDVEQFVVQAYERGDSSRLVARKATEEFGRRITRDTVLDVLRKNGSAIRPPTRNNGTRKHLRTDGYVDLWVGVAHPRAGKNGYVREHLIVIEAVLGRSLADDEQCHHRSMCRSDNRSENLMCVTKTTHAAIHKALRVLDDVFAIAYRRVTGESVEGSSFSLLCGELKHRLFIDPYIARIEAGEVDAVIAEIRQLLVHEQHVEEVG